MTADALIDEWARSTDMLPDFVAAPEYWQLEYGFALEDSAVVLPQV